jgi:hypothetical protein
VKQACAHKEEHSEGTEALFHNFAFHCVSPDGLNWVYVCQVMAGHGEW